MQLTTNVEPELHKFRFRSFVSCLLQPERQIWLHGSFIHVGIDYINARLVAHQITQIIAELL